MSSIRSYRKALVSFIDVIGFADFVKESETAPSHVVPEIYRILKTLRSQIEEGEQFKYSDIEGLGPEPDPLFRAFSFSDCTVRVTFLDSENNLPNVLIRELRLLSEKQLELACWSADEWEEFPVLLRGGISVGNISMDPDLKSDEIIFGPAMVRSYELEKATAVYPRIVLDRQLVKESKANEWTGILKQGDDGVYFLNYLRECIELEPLIEPIMIGNATMSLFKHRKTIEKGINILKSSSRMNERILQKYLWLRSHLINTCAAG
jgi:hypothetical protein